MRSDPIELGLAGTAATRRKADRPIRVRRAVRHTAAADGESPATDVIDEAFALLPGHSSRIARVDAANGGAETFRQSDEKRATSRAVILQLAAQLDALDQQRHQLAQLLRDIKIAPLAD